MHGEGTKGIKYYMYTVLRFVFLIFGWVVAFRNVEPELAWQSWIGMLLVTSVILWWQYCASKAYYKPYTSQVSSCPSNGYSSYQKSLTQIATEKRSIMTNLFDQYDTKRKELECLVQRKGEMDSEAYERQYMSLQAEVTEYKNRYDIALEEYRKAEIEAP